MTKIYLSFVWEVFVFKVRAFVFHAIRCLTEFAKVTTHLYPVAYNMLQTQLKTPLFEQ